MELKASREQIALAGRVAANVRLNAVHLVDSRVKNNLPFLVRTESKLEVSFRHKVESVSFPEPGALLVAVSLSVVFKVDRPSGSSHEKRAKPSASIKIVYAADYGIPKGPVPPVIGDAGFRAFAELNALSNCWPYFRSEISRLSGQMTIPFCLPIMRVVPKPPDRTDSTRNSNLKEIALN